MGLFDAITAIFDPADGGSNLLSTGLSLFDSGLGRGVAQPVNYFPPYQTSYPMDSGDSGQAYPVAMGSVPATVVGRTLAPVLFKIAQKLGLRRVPSMARAVEMVKKMSKWLSPAATAVALGIGVDELGQLIAASQRRKSRRMNPTNVRALRRSVRRLRGFDNMASRVRASLGSIAGRSASTFKRPKKRC